MGNMCEASNSPTRISSLDKFEVGPVFDESPTIQSASPKRRKVNRDDFLNLGLIGKGAFGSVYKIMKKDNGQIYAMKELKKQTLSDHNLETVNFLERFVLKSSECPFIVKLRYAFQTSSRCYFVMDYVSGGDLHRVLKKNGALPEKVVKFLVAEIILALEYLHTQLKIIYRDLKPENILLTETGHIKLTDFGLATYIKDEHTYTIAGTPEYLAPEIIARSGHTYEVDFWTLGILIYEMLTGNAPFTCEDRNVCTIQNLIMQNKPIYSPKISSNARSLISSLLRFNPKERLGAKSFDDLKRHNFFQNIDFLALSQGQLQSPLENVAQKNKVEQEESLNPIKNEDRFQNSPLNCLPIDDFSYDPHLENETNALNE
ncbi:unnamed protein product [Paramecium octaurelia]|uniref:non-specific serine/threonine protein kinase n=1 Tax=Paramecium octaurelia TaxID=43137 RepID=A0A8S1VQ89_PAROT|nr:unnamed protein product [Paramecium octaurelia]